MRTDRADIAFEHSLLVSADPIRTIAAFFDPVALAAWWQTIRSVTTPRPLGIYAVEWDPTPFLDDVLGPLGGTLYGTVMEFRPDREFFVAGMHWLPPQGDPIGPMALEVSCRRDASGSRLRVRQSGYEDNHRWHRYYRITASGWQSSLAALQIYLEQGSPERPSDHRWQSAV